LLIDQFVKEPTCVGEETFAVLPRPSAPLVPPPKAQIVPFDFDALVAYLEDATKSQLVNEPICLGEE
jgi:hypothetical protein